MPSKARKRAVNGSDHDTEVVENIASLGPNSGAHEADSNRTLRIKYQERQLIFTSYSISPRDGASQHVLRKETHTIRKHQKRSDALGMQLSREEGCPGGQQGLISTLTIAVRHEHESKMIFSRSTSFILGNSTFPLKRPDTISK